MYLTIFLFFPFALPQNPIFQQGAHMESCWKEKGKEEIVFIYEIRGCPYGEGSGPAYNP